MGLKGLILNNIYFRRGGGSERTDFQKFAPWEETVVLKTSNLGNCYFGWCGSFVWTFFK